MCSHISSSNSTHKMIPLFYKVEPSHVRYPRNEKGPYAKAFHDHSTKGRYTTETIEQWKKALKQAYDLSGFSLEDASGYEGKLVKLVLTEILNTLDIGSLDVANNHPVGLTERIDKVKNLLRANQNDKRVSTLGIWGMGGIGKTTLSKAVFNDMKSIFDGSCFVSDVRERTLKEGLTKLQEQILNELLHLELKVNSVDAGKMKMRERLRSKRVLLILDDVDDRKQLEALHVDRCFGGGSRVIITNPDKHILNLGQADEIYEAEELEHHQALQLFCWHAFLRVCPDEGYEHLSERVVKACKGIPLSLEVMGAHLYDKKDNKALWDEAVSRIESMMEKDLYDTLEISFNGLPEEERQIFLDIVFFFLGEDTATSIEIWKAIGCKNPQTTIANLLLKSLIRVKYDRFSIHDHLRDLGREIVAEEYPQDPCKRSRLWHPNDVRRVLGESKENSNLRGFKWSHFENVVPMESLALMKNLAFLWLENVRLNFQLKTQHSCDLLEFLTLPEGLVVANISGLSKLRRISFNNRLCRFFRGGESQMKELKVLKVSHCASLRKLPGLGSLTTLTKLELSHCDKLAELPPLPRGLVEAHIHKCSRLKTISFDVSQMNEFKVLEVSDCGSLTKLPGLGSLTSLTKLELSSCHELAELTPLPRGPVLARIKRCSQLNLRQCIQGLSGLQVLCPSPNRILEIELQLRMQRMLKPTKGIRLGEYCVLEDAKCTGIVVCLVSVAGIEVVNISTEDNKILTHITLPYFNCYEDEHHVRIIQEELPSIIKFRSGDIIRCSTSHGTQIVGVYLVLDQNESGNDEVDIQSNQSLHMDDRPLNAHD